MVIFPQSAFRVSMKASEEFLRDLKKTRDAIRLDRENANAGRALRIARLRSGSGKLEGWMLNLNWLSPMS